MKTLFELRNSPHFRNAAWSFLEYAFYPLAMLAATPVLLSLLGAERYGLWMLVFAITSLGGVANVGMGAATTRFVARFRGEGDLDRAGLVIRQTLTLALLGAFVLTTALAASANWLALNAFEQMGQPSEVTVVLRLTALVLLLQQIEVVYSTAIKGFERFDLAAPFEIGLKLSMVALSIAIAYTFADVQVMVLGLATVSLAGISLRARALAQLTGGRVLLPAWDAALAREVFGFGAWTWFQGVSSSLFHSADRLILASLLGAATVATYSVCTQLAQQIHAIPLAGMAFLFPLMSRRQSTGGGADVSRVARRGILINLGLSLPLWALLAAFGTPILHLWLGQQIDSTAGSLLFTLSLAYLLLGVNVAPHYLLLGRGEARFVSVANVIGGALSVAGAIALVPTWGVQGAAVSRMLYALPLFIGFARLLTERERKQQ